MRVLIVAKTRRGNGACVGALTQDGGSVRLLPFAAADHAGLEYNIGEVWELDAFPEEKPTPPHIENIIVRSGRRLKRVNNVEEIIHRLMPPVTGGPELLFEQRMQHLPSGALFISERGDVPSHSTMFWIPDQPLQMDLHGKRIRYRYPTEDGGRTLTFVGFQEPLEIIPAGSLLRVSLAHWWRPADKPEEELRCHAQLSGWFLSEQPFCAKDKKSQGAPCGATPGFDHAREVLKQTFGYADFLPLQAEIISRVLQGEDTLVIMPTGGGKSLCYQLPALLLDGLTVVVSPLISLMRDQVSQLRELRIPAEFLNSALAHAEYLAVANRVREREARILYVAPETLLRPESLVLLEQSKVVCFAVDEAHCISQWGHDFRPEYRQVQQVRQRFPETVCLALTATATPRVREDIRRLLGIPRTGEFTGGFNRPNLFLGAQTRRDGLGQTLAFLKRHRGEAGIIYCTTKKQVDQLAAELKARGWAALPYHAGLEKDVRQRNQDQFIREEAIVMVATVAFGMGINKSNVRFVLHYNLPKDIESYYQEIGRAGRDGLPAECLLLFSRADAVIIRRFIDEGAPSERPGRLARLNAMLLFAESPGCRRGPLLSYFGEAPARPCGYCDNCNALAPESAPSQHDPALFEQLRRRRRELADEAGVPAYVIFSDRVLLDMAADCPRTPEQFLAINGVGQVKLAKYGQAFLAVIRAHCAGDRKANRNDLAQTEDPADWLTIRRRFEEIGEAFAAGESLQGLATRLGIKRNTVLENLERYFDSGKPLEAEHLLQETTLSRSERDRVMALFGKLGHERLSPIYEALNGAICYEELKLVRLIFLCGGPHAR